MAKGTLESHVSDFTRMSSGDRLSFEEITEVLDKLFKSGKYVLP